MLEFFFFVLILCGAIWGSAIVFALAGRASKRLESGNQDDMIRILREEVESLSERLGRVEEEVDFYKQLQAPKPMETPLLGKRSEDTES